MTTYNLVVKQPFMDFKRGELISDQTLVNSILNANGENHNLMHHVVKVAAIGSTPAASKPVVNINTVAQPHDMSTSTV